MILNHNVAARRVTYHCKSRGASTAGACHRVDQDNASHKPAQVREKTPCRLGRLGDASESAGNWSPNQ